MAWKKNEPTVESVYPLYLVYIPDITHLHSFLFLMCNKFNLHGYFFFLVDMQTKSKHKCM